MRSGGGEDALADETRQQKMIEWLNVGLGLVWRRGVAPARERRGPAKPSVRRISKATRSISRPALVQRASLGGGGRRGGGIGGDYEPVGGTRRRAASSRVCVSIAAKNHRGRRVVAATSNLATCSRARSSSALNLSRRRVWIQNPRRPARAPPPAPDASSRLPQTAGEWRSSAACARRRRRLLHRHLTRTRPLRRLLHGPPGGGKTRPRA